MTRPLAVLLSLVMLAGCGTIANDQSAAPAPTIAATSDRTVAVAVATRSPTPTTVAVRFAAVDDAAVDTVTPVPIPAKLLNDCLQYVELAAFLGDHDAQVMWNESSQNEDTQRARCAAIGQSDSSALAVMSSRLAQLQHEISAATATTRPPPAPRPAAPSPARPTPTLAPAPEPDNSGATAVCRDGTLSYSAHRQGTCSHHGGVGRWL